jgi:hypothetical protein
MAARLAATPRRAWPRRSATAPSRGLAAAITIPDAAIMKPHWALPDIGSGAIALA